MTRVTIPGGEGTMKLGEQLVLERRITPTQLQSVLAYQKRWSCKFGEALLASNLLSSRDVLSLVARKLGVPYVELDVLRIPEHTVGMLPSQLLARHAVIPLGTRGSTARAPMMVAMSEPQNLRAVDDISFAAGRPIMPVLAMPQDIQTALRRHGIILGRPFDPLELPEDAEDLVITRGVEVEFLQVQSATVPAPQTRDPLDWTVAIAQGQA
ncbi:MAG: hypothetical protein AB2A00_17460 [Myxococcota bacterium]